MSRNYDRKCLHCGSNKLYRDRPQSLIVKCECGAEYKTHQPLRPYKTKTFWASKSSIKGKHTIEVWLNPIDKTKYSFLWVYEKSLPYQFNEYQQNPMLSGCFENPETALQAGIDWVYEQ